MKFFAIILLSLTCISCGKEHYDPVFNDFSLIGYWLSDDGRYIFDIKGVKGEGDEERYFEYYEGNGRFVRRHLNGLQTVYEVIKITPDELQVTLMRGGGFIQFYRVK